MVDNKAEDRRLVQALRCLESLIESEQWEDPQPKNLGASVAARRSGNDLYATERAHNVKIHLQILKEYTRSIALALPGSEELGLAYGNRSALLHHLGRHQESILDIERALELPVGDQRRIKYLCRKVDCEVALNMDEDAKSTCQQTQHLLLSTETSMDEKTDSILSLVNSMHKLKIADSMSIETLDDRPIEKKAELYQGGKFEQRSSECPDASSAIAVTKGSRNVRYGRYLTATRDIVPGETLYSGRPYLVAPARGSIHSHCSHCLEFVWAGVPCDSCSQAVYCSETCRAEAWNMYHDAECKIIDRIWKVLGRMNAGRVMSLRMLLMAVREAGGLHELRDQLREIDASKDLRKKGFSNNQQSFVNNYRSAYSLLSNVRKKGDTDLEEVSQDSAVMLHFLAKYTRVFRKYFDYGKMDLMRSEDALLVGKLLSHYQHVVLTNATSVRDAYNVSSTDWTWSVLREDTSTGLYLNCFLSLSNHSCFPNVARCETKEHQTILYAIRPIAQNEQLFESYGPTYSELMKEQRCELLGRFCFLCDCIACSEDWPIFMNMITSGVAFSNSAPSVAMILIKDAHKKSDQITESLKYDHFKCDIGCLEDLAYAITLTYKYCRMPNWRLPSLTATFVSIFNDLYGYVIKVPETCDD